MKKKQLAAFGAIVVIIFTACENPFFPAKKGGDNNTEIPAEVPVVTLNITPANPYILGDEVTITANATVNDGGTLSYQWYSNDENSSEGGELIPDETGASYAPSTDYEGTLFYYVQVTNTLNGTSAMAVSDTANITVYDTGTAAAIRSVGVNVAAPIKDGLPATTAATDDSGYTAVTWNPAHNPFQGGTVYTVTVTLTAESNYTLIALRTAAINGQTAVVTDNDGETLTLSYTFAATDTRTASNIAVIQQPSKLEYTHGEPLDLAGLVVRLAFDTAETEDIALANFASRNISTQPANGAALSHTDHNGRSVAVSYGELTANTQNLTVNKAVVSSITFPTAGAITYGAALSTSALSGGIGGGSFAWADGTIIPTVNNSGYDVEFTPDDTVNYDYSGVSGWNGGTGKVTRKVSVTVNPAPIISVDVIVSSPMKGGVPHTTATTEDTDYICGAVSWSPDHNPFQGNVKYTATVTLTAKENYTFAGELDAAINNDDTVVTNNTGAAVTLSLEFDATLDKDVSGISIKTQPSILTYTHGDTLNLNGLVVTLTFDDSTSEDRALAYFGTNISTHPANGAVLHRPTNNNVPVVVSFGELTADTNNLTVNTKALTVTGASHTKLYDGTTSANGVSGVTFSGIVSNEDVSAASVTAVYTNAAAGTRTVNITAVTLTGTAAGNYTVTLPANITVTGGIIKANPVVTWPTNLTATYGQSLSTVSLPGNGTSTPAGTFTWTTPSASVGSVGARLHGMTFTPNDTANYNTLTQDVSITANPVLITAAAITVTAPSAGKLTDTTAGGTGIFSVGQVAWTPNDHTFMVGKAYTAAVTLTANTNYAFAANQNLSATINGQNATVTNNGSTVTLSYTFAVIADSANTGMNGATEATAFKVYDVATLNRVGKGTGDWVGNWSLSAYYVQTADIVLPPVGEGESNWTAIGTYNPADSAAVQFTGIFDGQNNTITNLTITSVSSTFSSQGMFGAIDTGGVVKNVGLVGGSVTSTISSSFNNWVGGLVGRNSGGTVQNCYFTGSVTGNSSNNNTTNYVGGVVGSNYNTVQNCYSTGSVTVNGTSSSNCVGGAVGASDFASTDPIVQNCYSTGSVSSRGRGGGVVGESGLRNTSNSYFEGTAVQNCVALNPNVTTSFSNSSLRRVGLIVSGSIGNILKNNYARSTGMTLTYNNGVTYTPTPDLNGADGANVTSAQYHSESWWRNAGNWGTADGGSAWDFTTVWEWNSATNLPILRNMPGNPAQNHTVQ